MTDTAPQQTEMVHVTIDGKEIDVPKGTLVIRAAEMLGITVPRFCDHPLLDPIGACRQCMVEVEGQRKPFTACTTTCTPDMVVKTHRTSEVAEVAQKAMLEFLLLNHPLDCPQCDKGGECPLQDQALAHGPADSRMLDQKRRYTKPIAVSAQVLLDRERCVLCARCTRFSQQISGDPFIELFERGALEQVAIYEDEPYESYFSGNVIQICPVGALTSSSYRFRSRPFDLKTHDSVCNQCSAGCNLRVDVRRNVIQRQLAGENMAVNESWTCDKGRFGYEYVADPARLKEPVVRDPLGNMRPTGWLQALRLVAERMSSAQGKVGVLTGGRLTDEDAYAVSRFARDVLATDNVDFRMAPRAGEERVLGAVSGTLGPTYDDVERAGTVVLAGLDPEEEVPILFLRLRKAWRKHRQRIVVVGPVLEGLEEITWRWLRTAAGEEARALTALAGEGHGEGLVLEQRSGRTSDGLDDIVKAVSGDDPVVVLAGERLAQSPGALDAAAELAQARGAAFAWVPRRANARGHVDAGLLPGVLPAGRALSDAGEVAGVWEHVPTERGLDTRGMLEAAADGELDVLYCIGVDPVRDFEDPDLARRACQKVRTLVVQDLLPTATTSLADVVLPAMAPQERVGSFTSWEGRRQPFPRAVMPQGLAQEDWDILRQLARVLGRDLGWETAMDVRREAAPLMESTGGTPLERWGAVTGRGPGAGGEGGHDQQAAGAGLDDEVPPQAASPSTEASGQAAGTTGDPASTPDLAQTALATEGDAAGPRAAGEDRPTDASGDTVDVIVMDWLIGEGGLLTGAHALRETRRPAAVWVNDADAGRLGIQHGQLVAVVTDAARIELPARVTAHVVTGCVVVPRNSAATPGSVLRSGIGADAPLRARLEPMAGTGVVDYPKPHDLGAAFQGEERGRSAAFGSRSMEPFGRGPEAVGTLPRTDDPAQAGTEGAGVKPTDSDVTAGTGRNGKEAS